MSRRGCPGCECEECPGFCDDVSRATILITLSGIAGTRPPAFPDAACPTCDVFNQTYPLTFRSAPPLYPLLCAPASEEIATACQYAYRLDCTVTSIMLHFLAYTTPGGDRRGWLEVRFDSIGGIWIQKADFLMASGSTSLDCLEFTLEDEPLEFCFSSQTDPLTDCTAATAFDLSIVEA
jgi:hypothetical protein